MLIGEKMNKKTTLLVFTVLVLLSSTVGAQATFDNSLSPVNVTVLPSPVVAGGNVMIRFQLYNGYDEWLYDTTMFASSTYPLVNASPASSVEVGTINPSETTGYYNYTIAIPNTTSAGTYTVTFTTTSFIYAATGTEVAQSTIPVSFYVQNRPEIKVVASNSQASTLYAGRNQTIDLLVENIGYSNAKNVSITISRETGLNILSSVTTFYAQNISEGSEVSEPLLVGAKNVSNTSLIVNITYYSSNLKHRYSSSQQVNLSVAPDAQFSVSSSSPGPTVGATDVPVTFRITNTGTSDATQVQVSLEAPYPITPVAGTAYITSIEPGASANMTFMVNIDNSGVPGNYPITLTEQWKQPNGAINQQYSGTNNYYLSVISSAGVGGIVEDIVIVVIIMAIIGIVIRRRSAGPKAKASEKKDKKQ